MQSNPKISGIEDAEKLLKYYLSCIEEEDLRSRRISSGAYNKQYVVPKIDEGCLFKGDIELSWDISEAEVKFFQRYTTEKEQPTYLYGYPVYRDRRGFLLPLFMLEVNINITEGSKKASITLNQP